MRIIARRKPGKERLVGGWSVDEACVRRAHHLHKSELHLLPKKDAENMVAKVQVDEVEETNEQSQKEKNRTDEVEALPKSESSAHGDTGMTDDTSTTAAGDESLQEFTEAGSSIDGPVVSLASFRGNMQGGNGSDEGDKDDGMAANCSSKMSKARSERDRGPARRVRNQQRLIDRLASRGQGYELSLIHI